MNHLSKEKNALLRGSMTYRKYLFVGGNHNGEYHEFDEIICFADMKKYSSRSVEKQCSFIINDDGTVSEEKVLKEIPYVVCEKYQKTTVTIDGEQHQFFKYMDDIFEKCVEQYKTLINMSFSQLLPLKISGIESKLNSNKIENYKEGYIFISGVVFPFTRVSANEIKLVNQKDRLLGYGISSFYETYTEINGKRIDVVSCHDEIIHESEETTHYICITYRDHKR